MFSFRLCFRLMVMIALLVGGRAQAATELLPKGRVIDAVRCEADATRSYALYVPRSLDYTRPTPVIFCLDPDGRGEVPVERFAAAAEEFGYLVAGSNDLRPGADEGNARAIEAVLADVNRRFTLDGRRVYAAGFSAGARVACDLAARGIVRGAIASGGMFPGGNVPETVTFPVFGSAGITDFSYVEMQRAARELAERNLPHRVMFHLGAHEWLPAEQAFEALAWLQLQAMRQGALARDADWIGAELDRRANELPAEPALDRTRALRALVADFAGLADVARFEEEFVGVAGSPDVRAALAAELAAERREEAAAAHLQAAVRDRFETDVKRMSARLRAQADADRPSSERARAARVLEKVYLESAAVARAAMIGRDFAMAADWLEMLILMRPERGAAYFDLAVCAAQRGRAVAALDALQRGAAAGFRDVDRVEAAEAFRALRSEPEFLEIMSAMRVRRPERADEG